MATRLPAGAGDTLHTPSAPPHPPYPPRPPRRSQVRRCLQVLCRRRKNNPVLLGDPGVGKTAIAEGLAQMIADGKVPARLKDKRLISLELGMLVADTKCCWRPRAAHPVHPTCTCTCTCISLHPPCTPLAPPLYTPVLPRKPPCTPSHPLPGTAASSRSA
jgi:hypothetical protein